MILGIDPGETVGFARLSCPAGGSLAQIKILELDEIEVPASLSFDERATIVWNSLLNIGSEPRLRYLFIEDYRIYPQHAKEHTGKRLHEVELIVLFEALLWVIDGSAACKRVPAAKKGKWPDARLKAWFPQLRASGDHELDALKIALAGLEGLSNG